MIYHHIAHPLTDEGKLKLDALLGDREAERKLREDKAQHNKMAMAAAGFKVMGT